VPTVAERQRVPSIGQYALIMVAILVLVFAAFAVITYSEFRNLKSELADTHAAAAYDEARNALESIRRDARSAADRLAAAASHDGLGSGEGGLRAGWRRLAVDGLPPEALVEVAVHGADGRAPVAAGIDGTYPHIGEPLPPAFIEHAGDRPRLLLYAAVREDAAGPAIGFVGLRLDLLSALQAMAYRHVDPASIAFSGTTGVPLTWTALVDALSVTPRSDRVSDAVSAMMSHAMLYLGMVFGLFGLVLVPALVYLIVRPLRAISRHIDRLKGSPGGLHLDELAGLLPIAETEKIRLSLNEYQGQLVDVHTTLEEKSRELWVMAHHDPLTGVKNRRAYDEYLNGLPALLGDRGLHISFALFDLNHFRLLNDSYGHAVGDQVLKIIAGRISSVLRRGEELFRIGGDEFAVVLVNCDASSAQRIAERCHEAIVAYDFKLLGVREPLRVSAGLASARFDGGADLQTLQWKADAAMYRAKRPGHPSVVLYDESMADDSESLFSNWVNTAVYDAITHGDGLTMHYQPIVAFDGSEVCYYEALVRIEQDGEIIQPSNILPVVEARRLEVELDRAVLRAVLADLRQQKLPAGTGVSINLSGPTLVHEGIEMWLADFLPLLADYRIMLEVTETASVTQIGLANEHLSRLRAAGFLVAIDDFGSGYSSVRYLASMPVDIVKFDISLIQGLQDESQRRMVRHLAQMILESGHRLVAEGIEDSATLDAVIAAGFEMGQGYLFGRPAATVQRTRQAVGNVTPFPSGRRA
jgi:diguanylate cyclase (GGDEF)-like protein